MAVITTRTPENLYIHELAVTARKLASVALQGRREGRGQEGGGPEIE